MFDMRYHIASLVAVFLALSLGILVGTTIQNKGVIVKQQQKLVGSINESIEKVKEQNSLLNRKVVSYQDFEQSVFAFWAKDKLKGKKVAVFVFENDSDRNQETKSLEWLKSAGAEASIISCKTDFLLFEDKEELKAIKRYLPEEKEGKLKPAVIDLLLRELTTGKLKLVNELKDRNIITIEEEGVLPVDAVVFTAGGSTPTKTDNIEAEIASKSQKYCPTVVVESSQVSPTGLTLFIENRLSTVDNIDCASGGISMTSIILGNKGNYGFKPDAQKITPLSE